VKFWIFILRSTGMPMAVQKCDFEPHLHPTPGGDWVEFKRVVRDQPIELTNETSDGSIRE
jgi:hypothetical protein